MIRLVNISLGYGERILIKEASAEMKQGTLTALIGRNGSGKSTLLRAMAGLEQPSSGTISLAETAITSITPQELARRVAIVTTERVRISNLSCRDVVALGRAPYTNWIGHMQKEDKDLIDEALQQVGMTRYAQKTMDKMSDGECQRIMIARALAQQTDIILLDEPSAFLDMPSRYELGELLANLAHKQNKCIIYSIHELDIALSLSDTIALIDTPHLHHMPVAAMLAAGHIERLFSRVSLGTTPFFNSKSRGI